MSGCLFPKTESRNLKSSITPLETREAFRHEAVHIGRYHQPKTSKTEDPTIEFQIQKLTIDIQRTQAQSPS